MTLLSAHDLHKAHGPQVVLAGGSVSIRARERVGLVGANGSGKSTLGRILAGEEEADQGTIHRARDIRIGYLPQEPRLDLRASTREHVLSGLQAWFTQKRRHEQVTEALEAPGIDVETLTAAQAEAASEVERLGGWDLLHRADAVITKLGIRDPDQPLGHTSGGEQRRAALARILVAAPELAVLDEPTNHLDAETVEWLEQTLRDDYPGAILLITHDRYLLDRVVARTLELEGGQLHAYEGGWEEYLTAKAERELLVARTEANRRNLLRVELEWMSRQPKARTGKQKARLQRIEAARASSPAPRARTVQLQLEAGRSGSTILELHDLCVDIGGRRLIEGLTVGLAKRERLGIIGPNAVGKTSLLRCVTGELAPTGGKVTCGKHTAIAYFDQARVGLDDAASIQQNVAGEHSTVHWNGRPLSVFSYLENFLFFGDKQRQRVGSLSGGERARVALAKLLLGSANVLMLDEPTNDLDVVTLGALERMLCEFAGSCLVVSHDRYFLDRVATSMLVFEGAGKVTKYPGNYTTYRRLRSETRAEATSERKPAPRRPRRPPPARRGLTFAEQRELEGLLDRVDSAERRLAGLEAELAAPELYAERGESVPGLLAQVDRVRHELAELTARWEELETKREQGEAAS